MKNFINISLAILLLNLFACKQAEEIPGPDTDLQPTTVKATWNPPAQLTGDLDADMKILEELSDESFYDGSADKRGSIVFLNAGSVDQLQAKVNAAGNGGIVVVRSGNHTESGTVTVSSRVAIIGVPGAKITSGVQNLTTVPFIQPAIHVLNGSRTFIAGIEFVPSAGANDGGTAILVENSDRVVTALNTMNGFQFGVVLEQSDRNRIIGNDIATATLWQTLGLPCHGIIVINGKRAKVDYNHVSNSFFGVWACDEKGSFKGNYMNSNYLGLILCNVPVSIPLPGGAVVGSQVPAKQWIATRNQSDDNLYAGYLVIDGANNNVLTNNRASNNGAYDIDLAGDSNRFGFFTPSSFENTVNAGPYNLTIKDCGNNNTVNGGTLVDIMMDPCM